MKPLICDMCSGTEVIKDGEYFICQSCGTKYTVETAKKMMIEGSVDVSGSTVKVDNSDELANLYQLAHRAKDDNNSENAAKYYDMILIKDPSSWEANFYLVYFKGMNTSIAHIQSAAISISNCLDTVLLLVREQITDEDEQVKAVQEIATRCIIISEIFYNAAKNHFDGISLQIKDRFVQQMVDNCYASLNILYFLGDNIETLFPQNASFNKISAGAWNSAMTKHGKLIPYFDDKEGHKSAILKYTKKTQAFDPSYKSPEIETSIPGACYVATSIYGSYDCPQVWTLRRYRDFKLSKTYYGRLFISMYYKISPTLVSLFGNTYFFKTILKDRLDCFIAKLQQDGITDTPYDDLNW